MQHTRFLRSSLDISARLEEKEIQISSGAFTAYYSKSFKKVFLIMTVVMFVISILSTIGGISAFIAEELTIEGLICLVAFFFGITLFCFLCIPTIISYRCYVNDEFLREEYLILFLKKKKVVRWSDVKYIKIKQDEHNQVWKVSLFNCNKKRLLAVSSSVVGLTQIAKKAKRKKSTSLK